MNHVRAVIAWIKGNPISLVCIIVSVAALVSFIYPTRSWASAFRQSLADKSAQLTEIDGLLATKIAVPPEDASIGEPVEITGVVNAADIKELERIYGSINKEYVGVLEFVLRFNRDGYDAETDTFGTNPHTPLVANPDRPGESLLFPKPAAPRFKNDGKSEYAAAITSLYASLDAGEPFDEEKRTQEEEAAKRKFMNTRQPALTEQDLVGEVASEANQAIATALQRKYKQHALDHHIYAPRVELSESAAADAVWEPGPFYVEEWVKPTSKAPGLSDLWHGQVQLWIQQDLVAALRLVNRMDDPKTSLIERPVKELEQIDIVQTYVGFGNAGTSRPMVAAPGAPAGGAAEEAPSAQTDEAYENALKEGVKPDFARSNSPTGRVSNALYDVHHARMVVVADYTRLPEIFDALRKINFMTVIDLKVEDVDEYEKFLEGYYYGNEVDAVRLDMTIELIYLRQWTAGHNSPELAKKLKEDYFAGWMPDVVREEYKLPLREPDKMNDKVRLEEKRTSPGMGTSVGGRGGRNEGPVRAPRSRGPGRGGPAGLPGLP